jgi:hypothetical protein
MAEGALKNNRSTLQRFQSGAQVHVEFEISAHYQYASCNLSHTSPSRYQPTHFPSPPSEVC